MKRAGVIAVIVGTVVIFTAGVVGLVLNLTAPAGHDLIRPSEIIYLSEPLVPAVLGGFLAIRRPRHPAGWLMSYVAFALTVDSICKGILHHQKFGVGRTFATSVRWAAWFDNWMWLTYFGAIAILFLLFPTGRLPSPRWRPFAYATVLFIVVGTLCCAGVRFNPDYPGLSLPVNLGPLSAFSEGTLGTLVFVPLIGLIIVSVISLLIRRRRAVGAERAQVRWLVWAGCLEIGLTIFSTIVEGLAGPGPVGRLIYDSVDVLQELAFLGIPIAIFVAMSRHGLFEIDRVVTRTVSYSLLTAILAACYIAVVTLASALVPREFGRLPVSAATLLVAVLFVPFRTRVRHAVDRRFNRDRFDTERVVAHFAERVRLASAHDVAADDLLAAVRASLQPAHVGLWLTPSKRSA